jgi:HAD superfamily hydrolase (TIGR01509 family)
MYTLKNDPIRELQKELPILIILAHGVEVCALTHVTARSRNEPIERALREWRIGCWIARRGASCQQKTAARSAGMPFKPMDNWHLIHLLQLRNISIAHRMQAFIFDLDGTLVDSVYPHTLAWQQALSEHAISCPAWAIHRRIGMSGELLVKAVAAEQHRRVSDTHIERLGKRHARLFQLLSRKISPLPGVPELLRHLHKAKIPHGIATSGKRVEIRNSLTALALKSNTVVIDGDMVREVKPEPDLFLLCQQTLNVNPTNCLVVGDAVWDIHAARRSGIMSVGLLTGGFGEQELYNAGAMRVYPDARALLQAIDELGFK